MKAVKGNGIVSSEKPNVRANRLWKLLNSHRKYLIADIWVEIDAYATRLLGLVTLAPTS